MEANILLMGGLLAVEHGEDIKLFKVSPAMQQEVNDYIELNRLEVPASQKACFPWIKSS